MPGIDLATLAIKCTTDGVSQAQSGLDGLTRSGANAERQMGQASTASATMAGHMMKLAAAVTAAYGAFKMLSDVINTGMKVETMGVVMNQIGKNVQISTQALQYFKKEVESTGVTGMEAMSALSKAMTLGLNLNQMKEFTTRVRDVAVGARDAAGNMMNTSQTVNAVMHGIQSGQVEVLRNLGVTVRGTEEVYKAYANSIGTVKEKLNDAQKAQAMMNEFMRASAPLAGAAATADETVGKQLASMARYSEEAKVALWDIFKPAMIAGVQALTQAFKDLKTWAEANSLELQLLGQTIGEYVTTAGNAALETAKWLAVNKDLIITLGELYIITKIVSWVAALGRAFGIAAAAGTLLAGSIYAIIAAASGLGVLGAIKSFQGKGDTGQGIGSPGTATMGDDMWEYANQGEAASYDMFQKDRTERLQNLLGGGQDYKEKLAGALDLKGAAAAGMASGEAKYANALAQAKAGGAGKGGGGGGGGGGKDPAEAAEASLRSFIETMNQETARGAGDSWAILDAWYNKQILTLDKLAAKNISVAEGKIALDAAKASKAQKIEEDFEKWYTGAMGMTTLTQINEDQRKLDSVKGHADEEKKVKEVTAQHEVDRKRKTTDTILGIESQTLAAMASAAPLLVDQLELQKKQLAIDIQRGDLKSEEEIRVMKLNREITEGQADELRGLHALENQAKRYAEARKGWMTEGVSGGLKAGSVERGNESATRTAQWTIDAMKGAETWLGETGGQAFVDYLHGKKMDLTKMFQDMGDSLIKQVFKMATTKLFDSVWSGIGKAFNLDTKGKPDGSSGNPFHVVAAGEKGVTGIFGGGKATDSFSRTEKAMGKTGYTTGKGGKSGFDEDSLDMKAEVKNLKSLEKEYAKYFKLKEKGFKSTDKVDDTVFKEDMKQSNNLLNTNKANFQSYYDQYGLLDMYKKTDLQTSITNNQLNQDSFVAAQQAKMMQSNQFYTTESTSQQGYLTGATSVVNGVADVFMLAQAGMTAAGVKGDTTRLMSLAGFALKGIGIVMKFAQGTILADAYRGAAAAYAWMVEMFGPIIGTPLGIAAAVATFAAISAYGALGGVTSGIASSAGGDYQVGGTGPRYVHQDETILPVWAAQGWRDIVSRENTGSRTGGVGSDNSIHIGPGAISIAIHNPDKNFDANKLAKKLVPALQRQINLNRLRTA